MNRPQPRTALFLAVLVGGLVACNGGDKPDATAAKAGDSKAAAKPDSPGPDNTGKPTAGAPAGACDEAHTNDLKKELDGMCRFAAQKVDGDVPLVPWEAPPRAPPAKATSIRLSPAGISIEGDRAIPVSSFSEKWSVEQQRNAHIAAAVGRKTTGAWSLSVASETSRADVATALGVFADSGATKGFVVLATENTKGLPEPRDPKIVEEIRAKIPDSTPEVVTMAVAREVRTRASKCAPMTRVFEAAANVSDDMRCSILAHGIAEGIVQCGCEEEDEKVSLFYAVNFGVQKIVRRSVAVAVEIDRDGSLPPGETWADVVGGSTRAVFITLGASAASDPKPDTDAKK